MKLFQIVWKNSTRVKSSRKSCKSPYKAFRYSRGWFLSRLQNIKLWIYRTRQSKKRRVNSSSGQSRWHEVEEIKNTNSTCYFFLFNCCVSLSHSLSSSTFPLLLPWDEFGSYEVILMRLDRNSGAEWRRRKYGEKKFLPSSETASRKNKIQKELPFTFPLNPFLLLRMGSVNQMFFFPFYLVQSKEAKKKVVTKEKLEAWEKANQLQKCQRSSRTKSLMMKQERKRKKTNWN